jgi:tetratricopeptide (TPR) repeat protein
LYTCQRRGEEARRCFQACGEAFADSDYDRALLLDRLGVLYLQEGDGARAVALHQASLQILRRLRLPPGDPLRLREWQVRLHLSESYLAQGHYSEAEGEWRFCEKMGQPMDQLPLCRAQVGLLWARIYHAQGRESDAREALAQADHLLEAALIHPGPVGTVLRQRADYHLFRGDVAMDRGDGPEAAGAYGQALQWAARFAEPFAHQKLDLVLQRLEQQFFAGDPLHSDDNRCQAARSFCEALAASLQESSLAARLASVIRNLTQPGLSLALPHLC